MTYNILMGGRGGSDLHCVVRSNAPDALLINESPKTPVLWNRRCRRLAEAWEMRYVAGGRPAGSNMIAVHDGVVVKASGTETLRQPVFQPRRGIVWAQLRLQGRLLGVVCCHLSLDPERRLREVDRVLEVADRLRGPVIIGGDLNEQPAGPVWLRLAGAGFVDHGSRRDRTFPADDPRKRIDALVVRGSVDVLTHGVPALDEELMGRASDHRPVLATLALR
jgi:endonuclease/exonuclease/phosphatase family metal-dependent hydrolase